jgi:hypothetical protein
MKFTLEVFCLVIVMKNDLIFCREVGTKINLESSHASEQAL